MKMSPPNCSVKMSSPHGDFHDEQEGSTTRRSRGGSPGRQDHEPGGRPGVASHRATVQAPQGPRPSARPARLGPSPPRPALAAAVARRPPHPGRHAHDDDLRGLQRRPPHREAAAAPRPAGEPGDRTPDSAGARPATPSPAPRAQASAPAPPGPAMGQLAQVDASPFPWFEDRGPTAALHGLIDDATSIPLALWFRPTEDLHGYTTVLGQTCRQYGVPVTLYGDRLSLFRRNDQYWTLGEELRGQQDPTHFGRMLRDLGIGFIAAQSPQAKGRIERLWGTLQDRLVSELRLRALHTLEQANAFLPEFLPAFIQRFARAAAEPTPAWRPAPRDLERLLSCRYTRVVARDNTVRLGARWLQIPPGPHRRSYAGCRVELRELLDGPLVVLYQNTLLATQPAPAPTFVLSPRSDPGRDRQRAQHQQRARGPQLQTAVAALAHTLRARRTPAALSVGTAGERPGAAEPHDLVGDRKSTRLNSSHGYISYAVFCLKKKKNKPAEKQITDQVERANH